MAVLKQLSRREIRQQFTQIGWFGACPVYLGEMESFGPTMQERNGVPEWWFEVNSGAIALLIFLATLISTHHEPMFPILVTGDIEEA